MKEGESFSKWAETYRIFADQGNELMWPSETMVRLFKGNYIPGLNKDYNNKKILDIGFGNGNSLIFLATLGLRLHGTEVHEDICDMVRQKLAKVNINADLRVGTNRGLPFADSEFDFLVSWNVLHYEDNENSIREAIAEYHRVLKPGGRFFISTTGPEHKILNGAVTLGGHRYRIGRSDDFRKGQVFFYFDTSRYIQYYFSERFSNILVGRTHDSLFSETLDYFILTGIKD
jgi:ubiquinone/menaquinone biosynthesis C-methylase UbiE